MSNRNGRVSIRTAKCQRKWRVSHRTARVTGNMSKGDRENYVESYLDKGWS